jgi:hypothetical protein
VLVLGGARGRHRLGGGRGGEARNYTTRATAPPPPQPPFRSASGTS